MFCEDGLKYYILDLFIDYDLFLKDSLEKSGVPEKDKQMKYYFFSSKNKNLSKEHCSLINAMTIQQIFFDSDRC